MKSESRVWGADLAHLAQAQWAVAPSWTSLRARSPVPSVWKKRRPRLCLLFSPVPFVRFTPAVKGL